MTTDNRTDGIWAKLERLVANGVPLAEAIELIAQETMDSATGKTLDALAEAIRRGKGMAGEMGATDRPEPEPLSDAFDPDALKRNIEEIVRSVAEPIKEFSKKFTDNDPERSDALTDRARSLLVDAIDKGSSDLHIIPEELGGTVQFRIDGVLHIIEELDQSDYDDLLIGFKRLGNLSLSQKSPLQTQRLTMNVDDGEYVCRLDIAPTVKGETITVRISASRVAELRLADIARGKYLEKFKELTGLPWGMILFTGPVGSGKTTTMYSFIQEILTEKNAKVITIENPVEFHLKGAVQLQIKESLGLTQRKLFHSARNQDPDVLLFGDMTSKDSIDMAVETALTGHLFVSQMHTANAVDALQQLVDMGKPWWMLRKALKAISSQRLLRHLCKDCREVYEPDENELSNLPLENSEWPERLYRSVGCDKCNGMGYRGRIAAYEILEPTAALWKAISENSPVERLLEVAISDGFKTMWRSGWEYVLSGDTTLEELDRVLPQQ